MTMIEEVQETIPVFDAKVEIVGPETAEEWLVHNTKNRPLKPNQIDLWARRMAAGKWKLTGEAIKFATTGRLLDGQNRLHAIIKSGVAVPLLVVRGLDDETQEVMDSGSRRTGGDALNLRGERNSKQLAAAAIMVITKGGVARRAASNDEIVQVIQDDPSIREIVCDVLPGLKLHNLTSPAVAFYAYWILNQVDSGDCAKFFTQLSTLTHLDQGSPVLALHRRLLRAGEGRGKGSHAYRQEALACIFAAWNAWRRGESRDKIQISYGQFGKIMIPQPR